MDLNHTPQPNRFHTLLKAVIIIFVILILWHFLGPLLGITAVLGAGAFAFLLGILTLIGLACILAPVMACLGLLIFAIGIIIFAFIGAVLFPILWPFIIPIFIILLVIQWVSGKK